MTFTSLLDFSLLVIPNTCISSLVCCGISSLAYSASVTLYRFTLIA
uniref:Uncharacterized protein n=1 Tax=Amphimedon queenslandica TaxID=400682 RepID=A0A1X7TU38_AMPQE